MNHDRPSTVSDTRLSFISESPRPGECGLPGRRLGYVGEVIVNGVPITDDEAKTLVGLLLLDSEPDALSVAAAIEVAFAESVEQVELSVAGRTAVSSVLERAWRTREGSS